MNVVQFAQDVGSPNPEDAITHAMRQFTPAVARSIYARLKRSGFRPDMAMVLQGKWDLVMKSALKVKLTPIDVSFLYEITESSKFVGADADPRLFHNVTQPLGASKRVHTRLYKE